MNLNIFRDFKRVVQLLYEDAAFLHIIAFLFFTKQGAVAAYFSRNSFVWSRNKYELIYRIITKYLDVASCNQRAHAMRYDAYFIAACPEFKQVYKLFQPYGVSFYVFAFLRCQRVVSYVVIAYKVVASFYGYRL